MQRPDERAVDRVAEMAKLAEQSRRIDDNAASAIATLTSDHGDLDVVVNDILRIVQEIVPSELPALFLYDEDSDDMIMHAPAPTGLRRISMNEPSIIRRIFHTSIGEAVNDVTTDPDASPLLSELLKARQVAAVPISIGTAMCGVVAAINSERGAFTDNDTRRLGMLADRAGLVLETTRLRFRLQRQSQELEGLNRLSRLLTSTDSTEQVIAEAVQILTSLVACERMVVLLHDDESNSLVAHQSAIGVEQDGLATLEVGLGEPSLVSSVFRTNTPLMSNDVEDDAWVGSYLRNVLDARSLLAVPLTAGPRAIGVLLAVNPRRGRFTDEDLRFVALLGSRIGGVIETSSARDRERALLQRLREADRTKSEFVSMLAHELKGPMTTIQGFGHALQQQWDTIDADRRQQILRILTKETERLARLVTDLLDVSRMEAGTLRYELEPMSLHELVDTIVSMHPSLHATHAIVAEIPDDLPKVMGDRDRLRQVLLNLLTNATRYSPEGTTITISAEPIEDIDGRRVQVSVSDEGIGIAPEDRERIFSKFAMLPKPSWVKKGTGLGLYITRGIVEAHGGRIWVRSDAGRGSTFYFTLRLAEES